LLFLSHDLPKSQPSGADQRIFQKRPNDFLSLMKVSHRGHGLASLLATPVHIGLLVGSMWQPRCRIVVTSLYRQAG
jgi:hypothetical protein